MVDFVQEFRSDVRIVEEEGEFSKSLQLARKSRLAGHLDPPPRLRMDRDVMLRQLDRSGRRRPPSEGTRIALR